MEHRTRHGLLGLLLLVLWLPALAQADPAALFAKNCAVCHGKKGDGESIAGKGMQPPPTNFTRPQALVDLTRDGMIRSVRDGRPGTAMMAWKEALSDEEIEGVVDYIQNSLMLSSRAQDASLGRRLFASNCSVCHGDKGDTAVWARGGLKPAPRDFTSDLARKELTPERMTFSVTYGRPETAMPAWGERLSKEEIAAVVDYIRNAFLFPGGKEEVKAAAEALNTMQGHGQGHQHNHFDRSELAKPMPFSLKPDLPWGKAFYEKNCATCHGVLGDGQGPRAYFIFPKPRNFLHAAARHKFGREHLFYVISDGIRKTEMSAWKHVLDRQEIANITEYVFQTFIVPGLPPDFLDLAARELAEKPAMSHHHGHNHPGMPFAWILPVLLALLPLSLWALLSKAPDNPLVRTVNLSRVPVLGALVRYLNSTPQPLAMLKVVVAALYLLVIFAGLFGSPFAERNFATVVVWGLWWPLVIISVFFIGSAWCAVCPWETLSKLAVFQKLWRRPDPARQRSRKVPQRLRNIYPALVLFCGLTWLELGAGVTTKPKETALMALLMFILATIAVILYERKAFCRYFCPVGRTIGYYSRLAPIELRPVDNQVCADCKTMECYNGTADLEPCPTHLTVGRFGQNTFCLSCGSCVLSCPHKNVTWRLRTMGSEATSVARPQWDGAWFMLGLLGITIFHGITMVPIWNTWVMSVSGALGETGAPLLTFTLLMLAFFLVPVAVYALASLATVWFTRGKTTFKAFFSRMAFASLPLAFVYHLAHNVDHFLREPMGFWAVLKNPLGTDMGPLTSMERQILAMESAPPDWLVYGSQCGLMLLGFWLSLQIIRYRGRQSLTGGQDLAGAGLLPMILFSASITAFNLWLLGQDMVMRM